MNQKIQALVWKESVWGVPWGIFWHLNELTQDDPVGGTEITNLIQDFKASGATIQTNTGLVNWLLGGTQETGTDGNYYYKFPAHEHDGWIFVRRRIRRWWMRGKIWERRMSSTSTE